MIIHEIDVKDIKQYENNARKNDKAVALVAEALRYISNCHKIVLYRRYEPRIVRY